MFYYSKINNYTCDKRLRYSARAEAKIVLLLCCCCVPSRLAVKPWDQGVTYIILSSSVFYSPTPLIALFSGTWSIH